MSNYLETNKERTLEKKARGRAYIYDDGSIVFNPEAQGDPLYAPVGNTKKFGSLMQSKLTYKLSVKVPVNSLDPAADMRKYADVFIKRLEDDTLPEQLSRPHIKGQTAHGVVLQDEEKTQIVFTFENSESDKHLVLTNEIISICSIISSISKTRCRKSPAKKNTASSQTR